MPVYFRYVDDILMIVPISFINKMMDVFNSFHHRLQFTYEFDQDKSFNFLNINIKIDGMFESNWYYKPTFSGRYLIFFSRHPLCHKIGTIMDWWTGRSCYRILSTTMKIYLI